MILERPFKKRLYYATAMSTRLSVCPFVRPSEFSGLFSTCFDISILKLIYTVCGTTYRAWFTIGSICLTLQLKLDQTIFCNHGLIIQDKSFTFGTLIALCILLDINAVLHKNLIFRIWWLFLRVLDFFSFPCFFRHAFIYWFETWYIHLVGNATRQKFELHCNQDTLTYFGAKSRSDSFSIFPRPFDIVFKLFYFLLWMHYVTCIFALQNFPYSCFYEFYTFLTDYWTTIDRISVHTRSL